MNYEEAIDNLNNKFLLCPIDCAEDCEVCRIEAVQLAIKALEKQIPKKPIATTKEKKSLGEYDDWQSCPRCKMSFGYCTRKDEVTYCPKCGQAIDWEVE